MLSINPFAELSVTIPVSFLQFFVIAMILLIIIGTGLDMLHKKNVVYFFRNAQKAKRSAKYWQNGLLCMLTAFSKKYSYVISQFIKKQGLHRAPPPLGK